MHIKPPVQPCALRAPEKVQAAAAALFRRAQRAKILVGHHLGAAPKATCKASGGVPLYNMVNFNMTIT